MKAKDIIGVGFDFQLVDVDLVTDDTITAKLGPSKLKEAAFVEGFVTLTMATGGLQMMRINLIKQ